MTAAQEGRIEGYHGAQVGVATLVTASLYDFLKNNISPNNIDINDIIKNRPNHGEFRKNIKGYFGAQADDISTEFFKKCYDNSELEKELVSICKNWELIWEKLNTSLRSVEQIRNTLKSAGCPISIYELGLTPDHLKRSFLIARYIRNRFTVLDFAANLGILNKYSDEILINSGCL